MLALEVVQDLKSQQASTSSSDPVYLDQKSGGNPVPVLVGKSAVDNQTKKKISHSEIFDIQDDAGILCKRHSIRIHECYGKYMRAF